MNNQILIDDIIHMLSMLRSKVELSGTLNLLSINIHCENFYRDLLNTLYDINLVNSNFSEQNSASIDLIDIEAKIAYQVTSDASLAKAKKTVDKFIEYKIHEKIEKLIILNILHRKNHTDSSYNVGDFSFDLKNNIIDHREIVKLIGNLEITKLQKVHELVNSYLNPMYVLPNISNPHQRMSSIQKILQGISEIQYQGMVRKLDTLPYTIEDKINHNNLKIYKEHLAKLQSVSWSIQTQIETLEQNGHPTISDKLYTYVDGKFMTYKLQGGFEADNLVFQICNDIKRDLENNNVSTITLDDVAYVPYVVFYVFSKCKIFEKPPC